MDSNNIVVAGQDKNRQNCTRKLTKFRSITKFPGMEITIHKHFKLQNGFHFLSRFASNLKLCLTAQNVTGFFLSLYLLDNSKFITEMDCLR